ncbi:MAG: hypothetical protein IJN12_02685 [Clostridia bacterium]|nr:hypothetical protein [Clostridia bacterium]
MFKKITAILILVCITFTTACSSGPQLMDFLNSGTSSSSLGGITLYLSADLGPKDASDTTDRTPYLGYIMNTTLADAAIERVAQVETDLDVNIERSLENRDLSNLTYLLASGGGDMDAIIGLGFDVGAMSQMYKIFTPMSQVSQYIDIYDSEKWGAPERLEMFAWNGEIYGVIPNYWPELQFSSSDFVIIPNITYIESIGMDDPRDYFENGVWTLGKLEELIPLYSTPSANQDEVVYGFSANDRHLYEMLMLYYGADWAQKDSNGNWTAGALSTEGRMAAEKLHDYKTGELKDNIFFEKVGAQVYYWGQQQIVMSLLHTVCLVETNGLIPIVGYEYGVLPFPSQDGKSIFGQFERNAESILITAFSKYPEETAQVLSAIYEPLAGYEDEEALKEQYNTTLFWDERDTEVVFTLANSLRLLPQATEFGETNIAIASELEKYDATQVLDRFSSKIKSLLETELIPVKETMEKIFPGYND